ncbi:MAG: 4Fe4S-binding leucine-rich repeat protein, partial [Gammaproteobacteria bacterium]
MTTAVPKTKTIDSTACKNCRFHSSHRQQGRCKPGDVCVLIESGRQIDRFFRFNPEYA